MEKEIELFEKSLSKKINKRRIIEGVISVVFLITALVFSLLRESTKEVIIHGEGYLSWTETNYNNNYLIGVGIGAIVGLMALIFLVVDFSFCRFETIKTNGHFITVYRGMKECALYINSQEKEKLTFLSFSNVIETKLPDGVKVVVSFYRGALFLAHVSFSDNNPSIDI